MKLMPTEEIKNLPFMKKVGPEPLDPHKTRAERFYQADSSSPKLNDKASIS
ncbi:hypothetical protein KOY48_00440 [Candidatus Minimicrobia naudis]|uniref:Uncharacterized protein n=1 Tax=Candidatus Minimicrobia naudis TaxID=2841263 RepID=A0A8F1MD35_9BACT|nr:hypothetical protein KOY48_00440 [Candidatus Minimicrobia naudis]